MLRTFRPVSFWAHAVTMCEERPLACVRLGSWESPRASKLPCPTPLIFSPRVTMNTKQEKHFYILIASLFLCTTLTLAAQKKAAPTAGLSVFAQVKGKFTIQLEGHPVGHEEFEIAPAGGGWTARGTTDIKAPDSAPTQITGTLTLQPDGAPISYEWISHTDKTNGAHILFADGVAKITLE